MFGNPSGSLYFETGESPRKGGKTEEGSSPPAAQHEWIYYCVLLSLLQNKSQWVQCSLLQSRPVALRKSHEAKYFLVSGK